MNDQRKRALWADIDHLDSVHPDLADDLEAFHASPAWAVYVAEARRLSHKSLILSGAIRDAVRSKGYHVSTTLTPYLNRLLILTELPILDGRLRLNRIRKDEC